MLRTLQGAREALLKVKETPSSNTIKRSLRG